MCCYSTGIKIHISYGGRRNREQPKEPLSPLLGKFVLMKQSTNAAFLYRNKGDFLYWCERGKGVCLQRSRASIAVLICKSFHARRMNEKSSDYATPLGKPKYRAGQGRRKGNRDRKARALGGQSLAYQCLFHWYVESF